MYDYLRQLSEALTEVVEMKIKQVKVLGLCGSELVRVLLPLLVGE